MAHPQHLGAPCLFAAMSLALAVAALAQQNTQPDPRQAVASVPIEGVTLSGPLITAGGVATLGNNSTVSAGDKPAQVTLARGGKLTICATTSLHLSRDAAPLATGTEAKDQAGLMLALDRGALEADYPTGRYSDVVLTPDLRILISGPGTAAVRLRVNRQGDTCIDNHGDNAPYLTVSSLMDGGVYRVQANQRVLFEHGSLQQVVDREAEACGCPAPAVSPSVAGTSVGGPSSTPADTAFPAAVSEGLASPPTEATTPIVKAGEAHAQVTATLSSNTPPGPPPPPLAVAPPQAPPQVPAPPPRRGLFRRIGHFFARILGSS